MCCACLLVSQSCPTLCDPMDCSLPGSSVRGDSPGKNTEVDAMLSSRGSFNPGIEPRSPALQADSLLPSGFLSSSDSKESACIAGDPDSIPGLGRSPGGGHGNPLQYSCLENPHGQRSLVGCSPCGCKESDTTERPSAACTQKLPLRHMPSPERFCYSEDTPPFKFPLRLKR